MIKQTFAEIMNDHNEANGTYEYTPLRNYSFISRLLYEYNLSCRTFLRYLRFLNVQKSVIHSLRKPRLTTSEITYLNIRPNPIVEPANTLNKARGIRGIPSCA